MDPVRAARAWVGNPTHLVARARWKVSGRRSVLPLESDGRDDNPRQSRDGGSESTSHIALSELKEPARLVEKWGENLGIISIK